MINAKSVGIQIVGMILQNALFLVTGVFVARMIGAADYGTTTILRSLFQFVAILSPLGLDLMLQKYVGADPEHPGRTRIAVNRLRIFVFVISTAIVAAMIFGGGGWINATFYHIDHFEWLLVLTFCALPFQSDINVLGGVYRGRFNALPQLLVNYYVLPIFRLALLVALLLTGKGLEGVVAAGTISVWVGFALLNGHFLWRQDRDVPAPAPDERPTWRQTLALVEPSLWMAASMFLFSSIRMIDVVVLGMFRSTAEIGAYGASSVIAQIVQFFPNSLSQTLGPAVAALYAVGDRDGIRNAIDRNIRIATWLAAPIFAGTTVWGADMDVLFGASFQFSLGITFALSLGYYTSGVAGATGFALSMTGRHRRESTILVVGNILAVLGCITLIPPFGQYGAAISVLVAYIFINIARSWAARDVMGGLPPSLLSLRAPVAALVLAFAINAAGKALFGHSLSTFFVSGFAYVAIFFVFAWFALLDDEARGWLRTRIGRLSNRFRRNDPAGDAASGTPGTGDGTAPVPAPMPGLFALLLEDRRAQREGLLAQGFWALAAYRFAAARLRYRIPVVSQIWRLLGIILLKFSQVLTGIELPAYAKVGRRLTIEHFGCIVIHGASVIGDDCILRHGVTLGNLRLDRPLDAPILGNRVSVGAGAKILGAVRIGDGAVIGANAVVLCDVPAGAVAVGIPARIVGAPKKAAPAREPDAPEDN